MSKTLIIVFLITIIFTLGVVNLAWAQTTPPPLNNTTPPLLTNTTPPPPGEEDANLDNPLGETSIAKIVGRIIKAFLGIIGTISLVMFIYAGLMLLTAAGNSSQIQKGQQTMVWASLGILVVFASYAILKFVFSAFGL